LIVTERQGLYRHGPWLSRFVASVAWRTVLLYTEFEDSFDYFTPEQKTLLPAALEHWRAFVRGEAETPGIHELHFIPMGTLASYQGPRTPPPSINRYTLRAIEIHVASTVTQAFAFVKMGPVLALGFIQPPPPGNWAGTRVALGDGQVGGRMGLPVPFLDYFIERAANTHASQQERSPRQRDKITKALEASIDRAAVSETLRALNADVQMFGVEQVFSSEDEPGAGRIK